MATTSIWRVNGWLGKVLIYVENPDKTGNPAVFEKQGMDGQEAQSLSDVVEYAVRQERRTGLLLTTAINPLPPARLRRSWPMRSALPWRKSCGVKNTRCWLLPI